MEERLYDFTSLEEVCAGDKDFMDQMIQLFETNIPKELALIKTAITNNDFDDVKKIAHKMKPSVNYICIDSLSDDVKYIESWSESNEQMVSKTEVFINKINIVLEQLKHI